jgi:hypothetical protein
MVLEEAVVELSSSRPDPPCPPARGLSERERAGKKKGREKRWWHLQLVAHDVGRGPLLPQLHNLI